MERKWLDNLNDAYYLSDATIMNVGWEVKCIIERYTINTIHEEPTLPVVLPSVQELPKGLGTTKWRACIESTHTKYYSKSVSFSFVQYNLDEAYISDRLGLTNVRGSKMACYCKHTKRVNRYILDIGQNAIKAYTNGYLRRKIKII